MVNVTGAGARAWWRTRRCVVLATHYWGRGRSQDYSRTVMLVRQGMVAARHGPLRRRHAIYTFASCEGFPSFDQGMVQMVWIAERPSGCC